VSAT
jgi:hypothetical protein